MAKIEREWQSRLEERRGTAVECNDCGSQTNRVTVVDEASTKELEGIVEDEAADPEGSERKYGL